ncbi:hypothetical protein ACVRW7_04460 [Streptococcus ratti]|uniref:Uncharacterized protein n=1 Tax=Streptococcus ratti FA-1 = DSM 20564 TaxID=699248 RepID=A0ABN0GXC7_STRRT|nr:hypothetical protein SRA_07986 [Streptococcus ratti FA-1 = DSM 20564]EMP70403.1 hypothetical protein D822_04416 [Streptococcus ratti FA-1 = DSM 20564]
MIRVIVVKIDIVVNISAQLFKGLVGFELAALCLKLPEKGSIGAGSLHFLRKRFTKIKIVLQ